MDFKYLLTMMAWQVPHVVAVIFTAIYCFRKRTPDGILMLVGGILSLFVGVFHMLAPMYLYNEPGEFQQYSSLMSIVSGIALVFNIIYTVGFVLLMVKVSKPDHVDPMQQRIDLIDPSSNR